jgi:hypothetical protein
MMQNHPGAYRASIDPDNSARVQSCHVYQSKGPAMTSAMDSAAVRFPSSGTPLAHRNQPSQHPRAVAELGLLIASQPTAGIAWSFTAT